MREFSWPQAYHRLPWNVKVGHRGRQVKEGALPEALQQRPNQPEQLRMTSARVSQAWRDSSNAFVLT